MAEVVVGVRIVNLPDFKAQLESVKKEIRTKLALNATRASLRAFKRAVDERVPVFKGTRVYKGRRISGGTLKRSIYTAISKRSSSGQRGIVYGILRPRTGAQRGFNDAYYWRWVEKGHLIRARGQALRGGTRSKKLQRERLRSAGVPRVEGRWFLRDSFNAAKSQAYEAFSRSMTAGFKRIARGTVKRSKS